MEASIYEMEVELLARDLARTREETVEGNSNTYDSDMTMDEMSDLLDSMTTEQTEEVPLNKIMEELDAL